MDRNVMLHKPVSELNLSVRSRKCMNRLGINTIGDLVEKTPDALLGVKNFGETSLTEVREKLQQYGLTLRNSAPLLDDRAATSLCRAYIGRLIAVADSALDGDSNDAEHDALHEIREDLARLIGGAAKPLGPND